MIPSEENLGTKNDYEKTKQNNIKRHILEISNYIANQIEPTLCICGRVFVLEKLKNVKYFPSIFRGYWQLYVLHGHVRGRKQQRNGY